MGRFEAPIPSSCGECLLFDSCKNKPGNSVYQTKSGLTNTQLRGSTECVGQFDQDGGLLELSTDMNSASSSEPVPLHRIPAGLVGSRRPR